MDSFSFYKLPFKFILDEMPIPLAILHLEKETFIYGNSSLKNLFLINETGMLKHKASSFWCNIEDYYKFINELKNKPTTLQREALLRKASGVEFWAIVSSNIFYYKENNFRLTCIEDISEKKDLIKLVSTDCLTGIMSRRAMFEEIAQVFHNYQTTLNEFTLLMMDLDYFKKINDNYGHQVGDEAIIHFTKICQKLLRQVDCFGRVGGEEFIALLPETDLKEALRIGQDIRQMLENSPLERGDNKIYLTVSIGVTKVNFHDSGIFEIIDRADKALYSSKSNGRNTVSKFP